MEKCRDGAAAVVVGIKDWSHYYSWGITLVLIYFLDVGRDVCEHLFLQSFLWDIEAGSSLLLGYVWHWQTKILIQRKNLFSSSFGDSATYQLRIRIKEQLENSLALLYVIWLFCHLIIKLFYFYNYDVKNDGLYTKFN